MKSNYLIIKLDSLSFTTKGKIVMDGKSYRMKEVKIDTGCGLSTIPSIKLGLSPVASMILKRADILNNVHSIISYGVETGGFMHKKPVTFKEKMDCTALKFKHTVTELALNGYNIDIDSIYINYNRRGNILIGMDILSKLDFHCGTCLVDVPSLGLYKGDYIFLGCMKDNITTDYIDALSNFLGIYNKQNKLPLGNKITSAINAAIT